MGTRLTYIPAQFVSVNTATRSDLNQMIVAGVYIPPGTSLGSAKLFKVNLSDFSNAGEIPFNTDSGKDSSIEVEILDSGDLIVTVSEALGDLGPGSSSQPVVYKIPAVFSKKQVAASSNTIDQWSRSMLKQLLIGLRDLAIKLITQFPV